MFDSPENEPIYRKPTGEHRTPNVAKIALGLLGALGLAAVINRFYDQKDADMKSAINHAASTPNKVVEKQSEAEAQFEKRIQTYVPQELYPNEAERNGLINLIAVGAQSMATTAPGELQELSQTYQDLKKAGAKFGLEDGDLRLLAVLGKVKMTDDAIAEAKKYGLSNHVSAEELSHPEIQQILYWLAVKDISHKAGVDDMGIVSLAYTYGTGNLVESVKENQARPEVVNVITFTNSGGYKKYWERVIGASKARGLVSNNLSKAVAIMDQPAR